RGVPAADDLRGGDLRALTVVAGRERVELGVDDVLGPLLLGGRRGELEGVAAGEVDAEVEAAQHHRDDAGDHQHGRDGVPDLAAADDVETRLAGVEPVPESHVRPPSSGAGVRAVAASAYA